MQKFISVSFTLLLTTSVFATGDCQNNWIKVLVAQTPPPLGKSTNYIQAIKKLAPQLEQLHLRVSAGANTANVEQFVELITKLRVAYPNVLIGYHPDTSKGSAGAWGCSGQDWQCTFGKSLKFMNLVNQNIAHQGFDIYSLEQEGYIEDFSASGIALMKSCLLPGLAKEGVKCPQSIPYAVPGKLKVPGVKFGVVGSSYFGPEYYAPSMLDYNYPEMYNLYHNLSQSEIESLCLSSTNCKTPGGKPFFSAATTSGIQFNKPVIVADADLKGTFSGKQVIPTIVGSQGPQGKTAYSSADPVTSAEYFAFLSGMKQLNPAPYNVTTSKVYPALSGESSYPEFLGGSGWTSEKLCAFNQNLIANYKTLKALKLLNADNNDIDFDNFGLSIWNFYSMLLIVCPECGL